LDDVTVKLVETQAELEGAITVRMQVFVAEQAIPAEEELDDADATATHAVALHQGRIIGTGRLVLHDPETVKIGRMAVNADWRRQGIGGLILQHLELEARARGIRTALLHAQEYVKDFYAAHGYQQYGEVFLEVDIPHVEMRKRL